MDAYDLATRNTVEIVTEEDLRALLAQSHKKVYAGYEPSGEIHLGHLVTINKLVDLQAELALKSSSCLLISMRS